MKKIVLSVVLLANAVAYAGEPYVKTFYKNKNWTVIQVGITSEFKQCALRSSPDYFAKDRPQWGHTYLEISYPSNNVTFSGENIRAYFRISKRAKLQVDDGTSVAITPETPMPGKSIIDSMLNSKGKAVKIEIDFGEGDPSVHTFRLSGFAEAYKRLPACAGTSSVPTKGDLPPQGSRVTLTLDSFLTSGFAKQYGIKKIGGWNLQGGLFENDLSDSLPDTMMGATTKGSNIVSVGVMFLGTTNPDSSKMSFILELLNTLDPNTAQLRGIRDGLSKSFTKRVSQINLAPARTYGKLQVRAANVGGDVVISIDLQ